MFRWQLNLCTFRIGFNLCVAFEFERRVTQTSNWIELQTPRVCRKTCARVCSPRWARMCDLERPNEQNSAGVESVDFGAWRPKNWSGETRGEIFGKMLTRFLARFLTRVLGSENTVYRSTGTEKYSVQAYRVRKLIFKISLFFCPPLSPPHCFHPR